MEVSNLQRQILGTRRLECGNGGDTVSAEDAKPSSKSSSVYNQRQPIDYLNDILESTQDIRAFTKDMTYEDFAGDRKTLKAVIRCLEVIAEATEILPPDIEGVPYKIQFNCMSVPDTLSVSSAAYPAFSLKSAEGHRFERLMVSFNK